jgi:hypothetical protein
MYSFEVHTCSQWNFSPPRSDNTHNYTRYRGPLRQPCTILPQSLLSCFRDEHCANSSLMQRLHILPCWSLWGSSGVLVPEPRQEGGRDLQHACPGLETRSLSKTTYMDCCPKSATTSLREKHCSIDVPSQTNTFLTAF